MNLAVVLIDPIWMFLVKYLLLHISKFPTPNFRYSIFVRPWSVFSLRDGRGTPFTGDGYMAEVKYAYEYS